MNSKRPLIQAIEKIGKPALRDMVRLLDHSYQTAFNRIATEFPKDMLKQMVASERKGLIERELEQVGRKNGFTVEILKSKGGHSFRVLLASNVKSTIHYKRLEQDDLKTTQYRKEMASQCGGNGGGLQQDMFADASKAAYVTFVHGLSDNGDRSKLGYFVAILIDTDHIVLDQVDVLAYIVAQEEASVQEKIQAKPNIVGLKKS